MKKNNDELFQDRIDELLILEQRADRRAEKLIEIAKGYQQTTKKSLDDLLNNVAGMEQRFAKINVAADQIGHYIKQSARYERYAVKFLMGTIISCALLIACVLFWVHLVKGDLAQDQADLAALDFKLKHTPVILQTKDQDYVRIVPNSETGMINSNGDEAPGRYAEVWHIR